VRPLFLSLGNFLGARGVVLLLFGRLHLFLHRVLVRGFRRFVTHDPERKIHGNRRQPEAGAFPIATIVTHISARKSERSFADDAHQNDNYALAALDDAAEYQAEVRILRSKFSSWVVQGLFLNRISETLPTTLAIGNEDLKIAVSLFKDEASQNTYHLCFPVLPRLSREGLPSNGE
jgi:hypothetical protein